MGGVTEMTAALTMQVQLHQGKVVGEIAWCSGGMRDHQRGAPRVGKAIVMTGIPDRTNISRTLPHNGGTPGSHRRARQEVSKSRGSLRAHSSRISQRESYRIVKALGPTRIFNNAVCGAWNLLRDHTFTFVVVVPTFGERNVTQPL